MYIICVMNYIIYNEFNVLVKKYNISNRYIYVILILFFFLRNLKKYIYEKLRIGYGIWNVELLNWNVVKNRKNDN